MNNERSMHMKKTFADTGEAQLNPGMGFTHFSYVFVYINNEIAR